MASSSSMNPDALPFATLLHMVTIKLSSSNYLIWRKQMTSILECQSYLSHVDGSKLPPPPLVKDTDGKDVANPEFLSWRATDQRLLTLLLSSLTEESMGEVLGCSTAHSVWTSLASAYSHPSKSRELRLKDDLQLMKRGTMSVTEYGRKFKSLCEQLAAIGRPVDETDKSHWFLRGLGPAFTSFSATRMAISPLPPFADLLSDAEGFSMFQQSMESSGASPVAFAASNQQRKSTHSTNNRGSPSQQVSGLSSSGSQNRYQQPSPGNNGKGQRPKRPPHCQICRTNGHYADACPDRYASKSPTAANIAEAFQSGCSLGSPTTSDWYLDTGATAHMTASTTSLSDHRNYSGNDHVYVGNGAQLPISHVGSLKLNSGLDLLDVLVVPHITKNLLSISKLTSDCPVDVLFSNNSFVVQNRITKDPIATGRREHGLYVLERGQSALIAALNKKKLRASYELWHHRLGHVNFETISLLNKLGHVHVTSLLPKPLLCGPCQLSKSKRLSFSLNNKRAANALDLIHCDLWGPAPVTSPAGFRFYAIFIDDFSRFSWMYPLAAKSDFYVNLVQFLNLVENQFNRKVKTFQSDGGTEFLNNKVKTLFREKGIQHSVSCPHTPEQNGRAERKHRHVTETGLAMLFHARAPSSLWVEAFSTAVYTINRLPSSVLQGKSPFELLFNITPNYSNFHPFGCLVYPCLRSYAENKLSPRSRPCIFIGYSSHHKGFLCLDPETSRVYTSRHAQFDEACFPYAKHTSTSSVTDVSEFFEPNSASLPTVTVHGSSPSPATVFSPSPCSLCSPASPDQQSSQYQPDAHEPESPSSENSNIDDHVTTHPPPIAPPTSMVQHQTQSTHPMQTRSRSGIFKPRHIADVAISPLFQALQASTVPKGFKSAVKHPHWVAAMDEEMDALRANSTWTLVPRPAGKNIIGSKWVFRTKFLSDGTVDRHKARLVAQGFSQLPGFDYNHTFSPVVKASTVRIILSLAVLHHWPLHQLDVKNAFLNGVLSKPVYMEQPPGYIDSAMPDHVCLLRKSLYGLKQAPRAWYQRLYDFLIHIGFKDSSSDTSLFIYRANSSILILLVYVDDIILTGSSSDLLKKFISRLNREFAIKDLGKLSYFLGLEVSYTHNGLFLNQGKYAQDILERFDMGNCKPIATPLAPGESFTCDGPPFSEPTKYRSLLGALQYLTITRPDLSFAINHLSQFLQAPTDVHYQAAKRVLRYIKGSISFGISFTSGCAPTLVGYSDADWARCSDTRRSTYGYAIFFGGNLISWSAKKLPTVARSSCESEYRAMANSASEIIWVTHLLKDLGVSLPSSPVLFCDNNSAIFLSQNPIAHKRAKHIDIDYHFVRELVTTGKLQTRFVPSSLQIADIFTKSLSRPQFILLRSKLRVGAHPTSRLKGGVGDT